MRGAMETGFDVEVLSSLTSLVNLGKKDYSVLKVANVRTASPGQPSPRRCGAAPGVWAPRWRGARGSPPPGPSRSGWASGSGAAAAGARLRVTKHGVEMSLILDATLLLLEHYKIASLNGCFTDSDGHLYYMALHF